MQLGLDVCVLPACFQFMRLACDSFVFQCALQAQLVIQTCSSLRDTPEGLRQIYPRGHSRESDPVVLLDLIISL